MKRLYAGLIAVGLLVSGCVVGERPYGATVALQSVQLPPIVEVTPGLTPMVYPSAPDSYVWDGSESVGLCGGQHMYYKAGAWVVCDAVMLERFHGWERQHPVWRSEAIAYHRWSEAPR
jgi:hypothetical protein